MTDPERLTLDGLQRWMTAVLVNPLGVAEPAPHTFLPPHLRQNCVEELIGSSKRMSAREHLMLYQRGYLLRLRGCMAEQFPALKVALGDELFQKFADQYLQAYPPASYTLSELGRRFPDFLEETRPDKDAPKKETWPDFLIELARFEFAVTVLFDAPEQPLDPAHNPAEMHLTPMLRLFEHRFPVAAYYRAAVGAHKPELPFPETSYTLIVRKNFRMALLDLQRAQYVLLCELREGRPVSAAKRVLVREHGVDEAELERVFPQWVARWKNFGVIQERHPAG